ncbi:hypothetical protein HDU96_000297 [Phlyctochytrium bullatum]|nr:hypothetical protein HDU96_000297 [Phlyctochytrium bullatum]
MVRKDDAKTVTSSISVSTKDGSTGLLTTQGRGDIETGSIALQGSIRDDATLEAIEVQVVPEPAAAKCAESVEPDFLAATTHGCEPELCAPPKPSGHRYFDKIRDIFLRHFELDDVEAFLPMVHVWACIPTLAFYNLICHDVHGSGTLSKYASLMAAMIFATAFVAFFAFSGVALETLRRGSTEADRFAAGRAAVLSSLAAFGVTQGAFFVVSPIIRALDYHFWREPEHLSKLFTVGSKFIICVASGAVGSYVNGQGAAIGATCGALYAFILTCPFLFTACCANDTSELMCTMGFSEILFSVLGTMLSIAVTVPGYSRGNSFQLFISSVILGLSGIGPFSCIAATFQIPPPQEAVQPPWGPDITYPFTPGKPFGSKS